MVRFQRSEFVAVLAAVSAAVSAVVAAQRRDAALYKIGVGTADVTGPAAGVNMMGYGNAGQINKGIHTRLYSRAFIIDDFSKRIAFVSVDCGMIGQLVKIGVIENLQRLYGDMYGQDNVVLSSTHTHSGPGGYLQYVLFDVTSLGFVRETYDALVAGIVQSIVRAHKAVVLGRMYLNSGELLESSINRSPTAYMMNPPEERARYNHNTDKTMMLLKLVSLDGTDLGMINWFAVHPTSMNNTNKYVSGDNKGYASMLFEEAMQPGSLPGRSGFVAAFAQTNCGDVSPNTDGPKCQDTGEPCDILSSSCNGHVQKCYALGPGTDMEDSTKIIGRKQFRKAWELYHDDANAVPVSGPVQYIQQNIDMGNYTFTSADGTQVSTCKPALGHSFAAGTIDGPGMFGFTQGMTSGIPFWDMIVNAIVETDPQQIICHDPKPILLDTGDYHIPYEWHPRIVDTQMARIGQLVLAAVPGEFTTMAGRRLRDQIAWVMANEGVSGVVPVIAGLANVYSHYITTKEEYQIQRYEGASTIFGPNTHVAYMYQYSLLARAMVQGETLPAGPASPNLMDDQISLLPGVRSDHAPFGYTFGDVLQQPTTVAYAGETVTATFVAGHPRNTHQMGATFLTVERHNDDNNTWTVIAEDSDWNTKFLWKRTSTLLGHSEATVSWKIPLDVKAGAYRLTHSGHYKTMFRGVDSYHGATNTFEVVTKFDSNVVQHKAAYRPPRAKLPWWVQMFYGF